MTGGPSGLCAWGGCVFAARATCAGLRCARKLCNVHIKAIVAGKSYCGPCANKKHRCASRGCSAQIDPAFLMCGPHWCRVPRSTRTTILRTWRDGGDDYRQAVKQAIDALARRGA
jgi:hypothetical protein